ncbi:hypothetical protein CAEBREN_03003 [Caenorhabditis brenneri]|uniref:Uncharacterized protein n=1 Tax=Caenorhabditis brenneri TaxID=135651 RepID=G0NXG4_CAEBE|nr:hypothetical protein CAEBREN_03003 [Caenorhabditis brenneri]
MSEVLKELEVYSVENVTIKDKSMKKSLFSTTDSVPGSLRINKVTSSTADMSSDEKMSATDYISKTIEIFQILLNSGIKGLEAHKPETERTKKWLKGLNALSGLTEIFKGIVTITTAADDDPMATKLRLLRGEVDKTLMSALQYKDTNPIRIELDRQTDKRQQTFQKWESMISRLLGYFMIIEYAAIGYLKHDTKDFDLISKKSMEIMSYVDGLRENYHLEADYWPKLKVFLENKVKSKKISHGELLQAIEHELRKYKTTDAFFVYVTTDNKKRDEDFNIFCTNDDDKVLTSETMDDNPTKIFALIYRNSEFHKKSEEDFSKLYQDIEKCENVNLPFEGSIKTMLEEKLIGEGNPLEHYGLIAFYDFATGRCRTVNIPKTFKWAKSVARVNFQNKYSRDWPFAIVAFF